MKQLRIGAEIDPGVPWTLATGNEADLLLALKSGNFGATDFFLKAFQMLEVQGNE
jgi:3-dehydrotetronate 4-kinase